MATEDATIKTEVKTAGLLLPFSRELKSLDFDQFLRYSMVAVLLDRMLLGAAQPCRILEVGCNELNLFPRFLDPSRIKVTRCDIVGDPNEPDFVLLEADKPLPFSAESFDAVIALEVIEHIPAYRRRGFISECVRVARRGAIFTCPNGIQKVAEYEALAAASFRRRHGPPHPFLTEHVEYGLPREAEIQGILRELNHPHAVFSNAPLDIWLSMMLLSEILLEHDMLGKFQAYFSEPFLDGRIIGGSIPYRKVYVCTKTAKAVNALEPLENAPGVPLTHKDAPDPAAPLQHIATSISVALHAIERDHRGELAVQSARLHTLQHDLNARIAALQNDLASRDARIDVLQKELGALDSRIINVLQNETDTNQVDAFHTELSARDQRINALQGELAARYERIRVLHDELSTRDTRISELQSLTHRRDEDVKTRDKELQDRDSSLAALRNELAAAKAEQVRIHTDLGRQIHIREQMMRVMELQTKVHMRLALHQAETRSWKMTLPLRFLARHIQQTAYHVDESLTSVDLRQAPGASSDTWVAASDDPQFVIVGPIPRGWVRIRLKMHSDVRSNVEAYLDTGAGFNPSERIELGEIRTGLEIDIVVYLHKTTQAVRFDPLDQAGIFRLEHFSITTIPGPLLFARALRAKIREIRTRRSITPSIRRALKLLLRGDFNGLNNKLVQSLRGGVNSSADYDLWRENHKITDASRAAMRSEIARMSSPPKFSVIVPVYNPPEKYLRLAFDSVLKQVYPHWELCIADDCSTEPQVRKVLEEYAAKDKRIKVTYRSRNGHISAASNSALELATGEYIALLDNDDELSEHALFKAAQAIVADRTLDMIYSDEDKLDMSGRHVNPFFKPDWSPEYFLACMYTCHLGVYRTSLIREIGGFRSEYDNAQDYDLVLRLIARTTRIKHIPDVLYHWRMLPTSTASASQAKPKAHKTAQKALQSYLHTIGQSGTVEDGPSPGFHRVRYALKSRPAVSIIIPSTCRPVTLNGKEASHISLCVDSILEKTTYRDYEIMVLDRNQMPAEMQERFQKIGVKRVSYSEAFNWSRVNNLGASTARGAQLLFLNDDMEVITPDWIEAMLEFAQLDDIGAVGAKLLFPDGRLQHAGITVLKGEPVHPHYAVAGEHFGYFCGNVVHRNYCAVTGACMMTRAEVFKAIGGFTESFALNYNDVDYCLKVIAAGKRVVYTPYAQLFHHESATKSGTYQRELDAFRERWYAKMPLDPFYNPNFSMTGTNYRIETEQ